ncbi:GNAT family N-acetyltransferase [Salinibacterium sp. ZJ454]|uniref:GNAT family N-acetyltransferase n=1 Tax=Salinibacterium sp. ZJ454 TaxID=2708339 RepID=UPI001FBB3C88|nr:GNAT family N-acetyltransferase [Salinibacterium sp. ZJ454]
MEFQIDEVRIPSTLDAADAADFTASIGVASDVVAGITGHREFVWTAAEELPEWQNPLEPKRLWVARLDGRVVARAVYRPLPTEGTRTAEMEIDVLAEHRRLGIGSALLHAMLAAAGDDGRTVLQTWALHPLPSGPVLPSPTGFGAVPADSDATLFLLAQGFRLGQVIRISRLALPVDAAGRDARLVDASAAAGSEYRLVRWVGATPREWRADMTRLRQRMSTDAPSGDMDAEEDEWSVERLLAFDAAVQQSPRVTLTVVAEHVASGTLAGFTELSVPAELDRPVDQGDTLVLREHRGHRLGMWMKAANLLFLDQTHPGHPAIVTGNAEENRPMLNVNEALGFMPVAVEAAWQKTLRDA